MEALLRLVDYVPAFFRVMSFLMLLPFLGRSVPPMARIGMGAAVTLLIAPALSPPVLSQELGGFLLVTVEEVLVGIAMGAVVTTVMMSVYLAGQLIDVPMGFGMVNVLDPQTGGEVPVVAQLQFVVAVLVLFLIDGHHNLLRALVHSFQVVPVGGAMMGGEVAATALETVRSMFAVGLRIALPLVAALFLTDVTLGIIARAVPQINVFFVGFPLKVGLGVLLLAVVMPAFVVFIAGVFGSGGELSRLLDAMIRALGGA